MSLYDWSKTAGSNTSVAGISIAEGMDAGEVNDAMRGLMSEVAEWRDDNFGGLTTGGSSNAYTIATTNCIIIIIGSNSSSSSSSITQTAHAERMECRSEFIQQCAKMQSPRCPPSTVSWGYP